MWELERGGKPLISVVIPAHRAALTIEKALQSLVREKVPLMEVIVVEDGKVDHLEGLLLAYPGLRHLEREHALGAASARNWGLRESRGRYVLFLDADDWIEGPLLLELMEALEKSGAEMAFGSWVERFSDGQKERYHSSSERSRDAWISGWLSNNYVHPSALMWRRERLLALSGWNENMRVNDDGELALRALTSGYEPVAVQGLGRGVYFQHEGEGRLTKESMRHRANDNEVVYQMLKTYLRKGPNPKIERSLKKMCRWLSQALQKEGELELSRLWEKRGE